MKLSICDARLANSISCSESEEAAAAFELTH